MSARRYTVVIADRSSGALRHLTLHLRLTVLAVAGVLSLPILMGLGAKWSARQDLEQLRTSIAQLQVVMAMDQRRSLKI